MPTTNMFTPVPAVPVRELREYLERLLWAEICDALGDLNIEVPSRHFKGVLVGAHEAQVLTKKHLEFCRHLLCMLEKETGVTKNENSNGGLGPQ